MMRSNPRAFTIVELLVVVGVIALLLAILLPALGTARNTAAQTVSESNLRNLAIAHGVYAAEWNDRQFTVVKDNLGQFDSVGQYNEALGIHPGIPLGWADADGEYNLWGFQMDWPGNWGMVQPIVFQGVLQGFGYFRLPNARPFSQYLNSRFYDRVFYAPKDLTAVGVIAECFEVADELCIIDDATVFWSSYCFSPAALYHPEVMRAPSRGGWQDPWDLPAAFRAPNYSAVRYPSQKTHMLEHHWLQNVYREPCNPNFTSGTFRGCEPWYFNHSMDSVPVTLFYDGHIEGLSVREVVEDNRRIERQSDGIDSLWLKDIPGMPVGYYEDFGFMPEEYRTSFHILTTDGILGRDRISN